jgi:hypothetical protein
MPKRIRGQFSSLPFDTISSIISNDRIQLRCERTSYEIIAFSESEDSQLYFHFTCGGFEHLSTALMKWFIEFLSRMTIMVQLSLSTHDTIPFKCCPGMGLIVSPMSHEKSIVSSLGAHFISNNLEDSLKSRM